MGFGKWNHDALKWRNQCNSSPVIAGSRGIAGISLIHRKPGWHSHPGSHSDCIHLCTMDVMEALRTHMLVPGSVETMAVAATAARVRPGGCCVCSCNMMLSTIDGGAGWWVADSTNCCLDLLPSATPSSFSLKLGWSRNVLPTTC